MEIFQQISVKFLLLKITVVAISLINILLRNTSVGCYRNHLDSYTDKEGQLSGVDLPRRM